MELDLAARTLNVCEQLRVELDGTDLTLDLTGSDGERQRRAAILGQLDNYVVPRLRDIEAPALIVIGGSTGSGKSTLTNSLMGTDVTAAGVLRPTTRSPVLAVHSDSAHWFDGGRILGGLTRVSRADPGSVPSDGPQRLEIATCDALPETIAVLDAPDIDSVVDANRELAATLLDAADVWMFVTTAARYADAVPWSFLQDASRRGVSLVMVLNRVPPGAAEEIGADLESNLAAHSLRVPLFAIDEQPLIDGRLPDTAVRPLREWMHRLGNDHAARATLVVATLSGAVADIADQTRHLARAADEQVDTIAALRSQVVSAYAAASSHINTDIQQGTVLRGEVLARWQDIVGTGELLRQLESGLGRLRDRITSALTGRPTRTVELEGAIETGVEQLVRAHAGLAAAEVHRAWSQQPAGHALLTSAEAGLDRESDHLPTTINRMVREWQGGILDLLRDEGTGKKSAAKALAYGVNGVALVTMVAVFTHTGGLTGAEVAIAGGSSAAGQKVLEAILGDQMVRRLAERAREDLEERTKRLLDQEAHRYLVLLDAVGADPGSGSRLRERAAELDALRP